MQHIQQKKISSRVTDFRQTKLHEYVARALRPLVQLFVRRRIDPNVFTWASVIFAGVAAWLLIVDQWLLAGVALSLNGLCDVIDGALARAMPHRSKRLQQMGAFLDPAVDRINDGFLFIALVLYGINGMAIHTDIERSWYILFFIVLVGAAIAHPISSYYRARIESLNLRFQEKKPLTRAGFHMGVGLVVLGMWLLTNEIRWEYFLIATTMFVSLPTLINVIRRFSKSLQLFDQFR